MIMGFRPKHAVPLSSITVFGGSIANNLSNMKKRHPTADRGIISWPVIFAVEPVGMIGALIGTFLNKIIPEGILALMLTLFLGLISYIIFRRAYQMSKNEISILEHCDNFTSADSNNSDKNAKVLELSNYVELEESLHKNNKPKVISNKSSLSSQSCENVEIEISGDIEYQKSIIKFDQSNFACCQQSEYVLNPKRIISEQQQERNKEDKILRPSSLIFGVTVIVVMFINIMKGGEAFPSPLGIGCGSIGFWCANLLMISWLFIVFLHAHIYLAAKIEEKDRLGSGYACISESDMKWDSTSIMIFPAVSGIAGFFGGMFGIGCGIMKVRKLMVIIIVFVSLSGYYIFLSL